MKVAVIPARGGSKRIPGKNVRPFCGKPIIAWSIEAAVEAGCFDQIIVSTDDEAIAEVAVQCGATVPFTRPANLSDDHTPTVPVVRHAISWLADHIKAPTQVCCIYATAPFVTAHYLRAGLTLLETNAFDFVVPVTSFAFPIQRALRVGAGSRGEMIDPSKYGVRSQDLEECFHDSGQFYWGSADAWLKKDAVFSGNTGVLVLPRHRVQDIDTPEDWTRAEYMFEALRAQRQGDDRA